MAFTATKTGEDVVGSQRRVHGTYASAGGSTGGDINTGLHKCLHMNLQPGGSSVNTNAPVVNETLPVDGSAVTIVTDANATGFWEAFGDF